MMYQRYVIALCCMTAIMPFLISCSKESRDEAACWLRPSCLPSQQRSSGEVRVKKPTQTAKVQRPKMSIQHYTPSAKKPKTSAQPFQSMTCQTSAQATLTGPTPFINVAYTEPKVNATGKPLKDLSKTTIYYNLGQGLIKAKEVAATAPEGGGKISENIQIPIESSDPVEATICVTATNAKGLES